jgi:hypothetical protein
MLKTKLILLNLFVMLICNAKTMYSQDTTITGKANNAKYGAVVVTSNDDICFPPGSCPEEILKIKTCYWADPGIRQRLIPSVRSLCQKKIKTQSISVRPGVCHESKNRISSLIR